MPIDKDKVHKEYLATLEAFKGKRVDIDVINHKSTETCPFTFYKVLIKDIDDIEKGITIRISRDTANRFIPFNTINGIRLSEV